MRRGAASCARTLAADRRPLAPPQLQALALQVNQALGNFGRTCAIAPRSASCRPGGASSTWRATLRRGGSRRSSSLAPTRSTRRRGHRFRRALREGAVAGACRPPCGRDRGTQQLAPAASSRARGLERRALARRHATIIQPLVRPMYDSRSVHEIVAALTADEPLPRTNSCVRPGRKLAGDAAAGPRR